MILRRYGNSVQSVDLHFASKALTEIGFRRNQEHSEQADRFLLEWERVRGHELSGEREGLVQDEVEQRLLDDIESELLRLESELASGEVLLVESEAGADYPKTRTRTRVMVEEGENRLHFTTVVEPPLRVAVYRKRGVSA